jgi:hypothetical protein
VPVEVVAADALGEALRAPELLPHAFLIAGHADAVGSASHILDRSYRRALAVADCLVACHGIDPARLVPHGWGEEVLRLLSDLGSGADRRVEVPLILPEEAAWHPCPRGPDPQALVHPTAHYGLHYGLGLGPVGRSDLVDPRWSPAPDVLNRLHFTPTWPGR